MNSLNQKEDTSGKRLRPKAAPDEVSREAHFSAGIRLSEASETFSAAKTLTLIQGEEFVLPLVPREKSLIKLTIVTLRFEEILHPFLSGVLASSRFPGVHRMEQCTLPTLWCQARSFQHHIIDSVLSVGQLLNLV